MKVECRHWSECGLVGGGCCAKGFHQGSPTIGQCAFGCPEGEGPWRGALQAALGPKSIGSEHPSSPASGAPLTMPRPFPSARQVASFLTALATCPRVSRRVELLRLAICARCEYLRRASDSRLDWCGLCGCKVSLEGWRLASLAAYEENLPHWGCKHPRRGQPQADGARPPGWSGIQQS